MDPENAMPNALCMDFSLHCQKKGHMCEISVSRASSTPIFDLIFIVALKQIVRLIKSNLRL